MYNSSSQNNWYEDLNLEQKSDWYGQIANAYDKTRPSYPQKLVNEAIYMAKLSTNSDILEIGCGPGTLTNTLASLGFSLICLEPNREAYKIACQNCNKYEKVSIINKTFEEWKFAENSFDAVFFSTSFHWVSREIRYSKTADALKDNGFLILFWNTPPQPSYEIYVELLESVYQTHAPKLKGYEKIENYQNNLAKLGKSVIQSNKFKNLFSKELISEVTYTIDDYLTLLSTLSPYIAMKRKQRNILFDNLISTLKKHYGNVINLSYLSVVQIAQKV